MKSVYLFALVLPGLAVAITVLPNGNSPKTKMMGGMMVEIQKGFVPMDSVSAESENYHISRKVSNDNTLLPVKERYRRLIPYMTFYYANELSPPSPEKYKTNIHTNGKSAVSSGKRILNSQYKNIPRYQGNRLTQYNIASAAPSKLTQHFQFNSYRKPVKVSNLPYSKEYEHRVPATNLLSNTLSDNSQYFQHAHGYLPIPVPPKSRTNLYHNKNMPSVQYYSNKEILPEQQFKLVPYEQTPPLVVPEVKTKIDYKNYPIPVPVLSSQSDLQYTSPRYHYEYTEKPEVTHHLRFDDRFKSLVNLNKPFYSHLVEQKLSKPSYNVQLSASPETGFKPITPTAASVIETSLTSDDARQKVATTTSPNNYVSLENESQYYDYGNQQQFSQSTSSDARSLSNILKLLQDQNSIPQQITKDNVNTSIKTLVQVLNYLKSNQKPLHYSNAVEPLLSTPAPFVAQVQHEVEQGVTSTNSIKADNHAIKIVNEIDSGLYEDAGHENQYLEDMLQKPHSSTSQSFPDRSPSGVGGTPGKPGVDYPILTTIPQTKFDCKTQRYKGFFGDPETNCQVWHYCDLNGGQASFLCPNGTVFSQAGLTCDWWFNVQCDDTTQLYVLNERLYKYVLPYTPKFPEDYQGPLVDKYLTLKFKEMEEKFRKNKKKHPTMTSQSQEMTEEDGVGASATSSSETSRGSDEREDAYED